MNCWTNFEKVQFIQKDEENRWKKIAATREKHNNNNNKTYTQHIYTHRGMVEANPKEKLTQKDMKSAVTALVTVLLVNDLL